MTSVGAGKEPWKPRLQRLADARKLAPFERLVLELLVGCHVSPSVQRTFLANKPGSGMDEMTAMSPITVSICWDGLATAQHVANHCECYARIELATAQHVVPIALGAVHLPG